MTVTDDQALPLPDGVAAHLIDLDTSIRAAADLVARGRAAYDKDFVYRLAAEAISNRIGEAVGNIDESWRDLLPTIPWRAMRTNRNFVVHVYHAIDYSRLWNTLVDDVPFVGELLAPYIKAAYEAVPDEPDPD